MAFNFTSFFVQIAAFLILYWLLSKYAFGPLMSIMQKRQDHVRNELATAEKNRSESEKLIAEQREAIVQARKEAGEIIERARQMSSKQSEEMIEAARKEAARLKEQAVTDISRERDQALASLREQVGTLSVMLASKIIEKELDANSQTQLVDDYLKQVGEAR